MLRCQTKAKIKSGLSYGYSSFIRWLDLSWFSPSCQGSFQWCVPTQRFEPRRLLYCRQQCKSLHLQEMIDLWRVKIWSENVTHILIPLDDNLCLGCVTGHLHCCFIARWRRKQNFFHPGYRAWLTLLCGQLETINLVGHLPCEAGWSLKFFHFNDTRICGV
jgi:hypothetical protein